MDEYVAAGAGGLLAVVGFGVWGTGTLTGVGLGAWGTGTLTVRLAEVAAPRCMLTVLFSADTQNG